MQTKWDQLNQHKKKKKRKEKKKKKKKKIKKKKKKKKKKEKKKKNNLQSFRWLVKSIFFKFLKFNYKKKKNSFF